jgi:hypothetical protein
MRFGLAASLLALVACAGNPPHLEVTGVAPNDQAYGVALDSAVTIHFSEPMACATTQASLAVASSAGSVAGSATCAGGDLVFTPSEPLAVWTTYTVTVNGKARGRSGGALAASFQSTFRTGAPVVTSVLPANESTGVALGTAITVQFWEAMDCATVRAESVSLVTAAGEVPAKVTCTGSSAAIVPVALLAPATNHVVFVSSAVRDRAGNALAAFNARFTTADSAPLPDSVVPDSGVSAIALSEDQRTVYIGGGFRSVGRRTGSFVPLDIDTARPTAYPLVDGSVSASVPDGVGGWFIAGSFSRIGGVLPSNIAHILNDNSLDLAWDPGVDGGGVRALALADNTVYLAGSFTSVGGQPRSGLAAIDATTGAVKSWNPVGVQPWPTVLAVSGLPTAIAVTGTTVIVGGGFGLIAVDAGAGASTLWSTLGSYRDDVRALAVSGSILYVSGGGLRGGLAAVDIATGTLTDWAPVPLYTYILVQTLAVSGSTVLVGGNFTSFQGLPRTGLAAVDTVTGVVTDWNPDPSLAQNYLSIQALAVSGSTVYVAGDFASIGGQPRLGLAALDATTGTATAWNPGPAFGIETLGASGSSVVAGGRFYSLGGQPRNGLAAIDRATGALTDWDPNAGAPLNSQGWISAIATSGPTVYVGGGFTSCGGQARNSLAALDAVSGLATDWDPNPLSPRNGTVAEVTAIAVAGSAVYVGGFFGSVGGQDRNGLAALDAGTGLATAWNPGVSSGVALALEGSNVYAFEYNAIYGIDAASGASSPLPAPGGIFGAWGGSNSAAASSSSKLYVSGAFDHLGSAPRNSFGAIDIASGKVAAWDPAGSYGTWGSSLAVHGPVVYAGGLFDLAGGQLRRNLVALDAESGAATAWNPSPDSVVVAILATDSRVYVGGGFTSIGGETRGGFAILRP